MTFETACPSLLSIGKHNLWTETSFILI